MMMASAWKDECDEDECDFANGSEFGDESDEDSNDDSDDDESGDDSDDESDNECEDEYADDQQMIVDGQYNNEYDDGMTRSVADLFSLLTLVELMQYTIRQQEQVG